LKRFAEDGSAIAWEESGSRQLFKLSLIKTLGGMLTKSDFLLIIVNDFFNELQ
jgi:hypothetical protein